MSRLHAFTVDYRKDRAESGLVNRGFWLHGIPRLMPLCRLLGHRPVVDGVDYGVTPGPARPGPSSTRRSRWACCDRCGIRLAQPVDEDLTIGQPYTDPLPAPAHAADTDGARGVLGGQVVIGGRGATVSAEVKVGHAGSEHTLAGHLHLGRLGALYLHTESHGTWLQRRLVPRGYNSRVIGVSVHHGRLSWQLWARRHESRATDPWWMEGSVRIDPRDLLLGPVRRERTAVNGPVTAVVRMPQGEDYPVELQLERWTQGRARSPRTTGSWSCEWRARPGIPTETGDRGRIFGSGVELAADTDPARLDWVGAACGRIVAQLAAMRARERYTPAAPADV